MNLWKVNPAGLGAVLKTEGRSDALDFDYSAFLHGKLNS